VISSSGNTVTLLHYIHYTVTLLLYEVMPLLFEATLLLYTATLLLNPLRGDDAPPPPVTQTQC
jgi:hypothetical protein